MIRLGMVLAAVVLMSATYRVAHARMAIQTFAVLAGAGAHDVFPARTAQSGSPRNPRANSAGSIPGPGNRI